MPRHIAFLRAINVGGRVVKMDRLRAIFVDGGFTNVETFIASGNVAFDAKAADATKLEKRVETMLLHALGYEVVTFIRSPPELASIVAFEPFPPDPSNSHLAVGFLKSAPPKDALQPLEPARRAGDLLRVEGRELYWRPVEGIGRSLVSGAAIERALGPATVRNIGTVAKIAAKHPA
jgi:uncharacterized protein (DUF1697 family)